MIPIREEIINRKKGFYFFSSKKVIGKATSISFAMFTISILLMASTVALAATSIGSNGSFNTISINNNTVLQKQPQLPQPKTHEYTLIAQDTTLLIAPGVRVDAWTYNGYYSWSYFNSNRR